MACAALPRRGEMEVIEPPFVDRRTRRATGWRRDLVPGQFQAQVEVDDRRDDEDGSKGVVADGEPRAYHEVLLVRSCLPCSRAA